MSRTYSALLRGDRLEWTGDAPVPLPGDRAIPVKVVVKEAATLESEGPVAGGNDPEAWRKAVDALRRLAERGTFAEISDVVEWQREVRQDRPLLGLLDPPS
jgi:hypothetical protein